MYQFEVTVRNPTTGERKSVTVTAKTRKEATNTAQGEFGEFRGAIESVRKIVENF